MYYFLKTTKASTEILPIDVVTTLFLIISSVIKEYCVNSGLHPKRNDCNASFESSFFTGCHKGIWIS